MLSRVLPQASMRAQLIWKKKRKGRGVSNTNDVVIVSIIIIFAIEAAGAAAAAFVPFQEDREATEG